ncbi:MAG TPA: hypothetical protein EYP14_03690 [Planctomycetaceae bacterium]|nr:hypothetical protein [Planctomycetaceae bacterium]
MIDTCSSDDLKECLFHPWLYRPNAISLRWDPIDDTRRYALQAIDPTNNSKNPILSVPGANLLALESLPLFPSLAQGLALHTTGFVQSNRDTVWTWLIWNVFLDLDTVRSLIVHPLLCANNVNRPKLLARGVVEVYRARVVMPSGRYRNFTCSSSVFGP